MTVEMALALGRAAGKVFRRRGNHSRVVIGKDTRLSCYMFENALIAGLCSMGVDTLMLGPLPTPGVAYITRAYRAEAGIVISASHNPYYDNGIKFFSSQGFKLDDEIEREIERVVAEKEFVHDLPAAGDLGRNIKIIDAQGRYIEFIKSAFPRSLSLKGLSIVLDAAHGAGYRVAPLVFEELGADVFAIGTDPDGLNINHKCGALYPEKMQQAVREQKAHVGIALDGDGDRVIMADECGNRVDGDAILAICAADMKRQGCLPGNKVVGTVMSNFGMVKALEEIGIQVIQAQVGDRYVIQEMLKHGAQLGGEQSGHLIFLRLNTTGDGLVAALQVLRIMIETGKSLSELARIVKQYPQVLLNVAVKNKPPLESIHGYSQVMQAVEQQLDKRGRVLVRYSGTEKICRVMVEGEESTQVNTFAHSIAEVIKQGIGA
jgi:phosphoglucosamine mutase